MRAEISNARQIYTQDGRSPLIDIYTAYFQLVDRYGWTLHHVHTQTASQGRDYPIYAFTSPVKGPALWSLTMVHGEEPEGPNAAQGKIHTLGQLGQTIPVVFWGCLNPLGYSQNWRYPNTPRNHLIGQSVTDASHFLPSPDNPTLLWSPSPTGPESMVIIPYMAHLAIDYPPLIAIDHHADEALESGYIYYLGILHTHNLLTQTIIAALSSHIPIQHHGLTRFGEQVENGIVRFDRDGSVDEYLYTKLQAKAVFTIETPTLGISLAKRVAAQSSIFDLYPKLYNQMLQLLK